jgi:hypothetical protein
MPLQMPPVQSEFFALEGGWDLVTPRLKIKPGRCRQITNYYGKVGGGYRRLGGYEPYDGRSRPSQQTFTLLTSTLGLTGVAVSDTITGNTSGATGKVMEYVSGASGYAAVTRVTGTFTDGETLSISGSPIGIYNDVAQNITGLDDNRINALVEAEYRSSITTVPGSGDVLGVFEYNDSLYALRNNAGGTAAVLFKESTAGWTAVPLNYEIVFSNANTGVGEGDTIAQGAASATILRVVVETGTLASGTNTGRLILSAASTFAAGAATSTGGGALTLSGAATAITLLPSGHYEFIEYNFSGSTATSRMYGCDGVNYGFEFDGTVWVKIHTGMVADVPDHVFAHRNYLFFSFLGSLQHSGIVSPYVWTPLTGADELGMGSDIVGMTEMSGSETSGALMVFTRKRIAVLYGASPSTWQLTDYANKIGAAEGSLQMVGTTPVFFDDQGLTTSTATQAFGSFSTASFSRVIQPFLKGKVDNVVASLVYRAKSLYLLFLDDKTGVAVTFGPEGAECITSFVLEHQVTCAWETTRNGGEIFVGCTDGYVYQLEAGRTFGGEDIVAFMAPAFNHSKSPLTRKQYRRAQIECTGESAFTIRVGNALDYDNPDVSQNDPTTKISTASGGSYDINNYDEISYDGADALKQWVSLRGFGANISIFVYSESDDELPHELDGILLNYTPRRLDRDFV